MFVVVMLRSVFISVVVFLFSVHSLKGCATDSLFLRIFQHQQANEPDVYRFVDSLRQQTDFSSQPNLVPHFWLWKGQAYLNAFDKTDSAFVFASQADSIFSQTENRPGQLQTQWLYALLHIKDRSFVQAQSHLQQAFHLAASTFDSARCLNLKTMWMMHRNDSNHFIPQAKTAVAIFDRIPVTSNFIAFHKATAYRNLAWCYQSAQDQVNHQIALNLWHKVLNIGNFSAANNAPTYLYILQNIVYCHRFIGQVDSASHYMEIAEDVLKTGKFPNIHWQRMNFYRQYSWLEYERGNYKQAMDYLGVSRAETDNYYNAKLESTATSIANNYEKKLRDKEIKNLTEQNKTKNQSLLILAISLILLATLTFITFYQFQKTKKQNIEIAHQRDQLEVLSKNLELSLAEVHHRVKNNLQIVNSLLNVQKNKLKSQEAKDALGDSQARIRAIALVHEQLYSPSEFEAVNLKHYSEKVIRSILQSTPPPEHVNVTVVMEDAKMALDKSVSAGIILNELITNALKYAFNDHTAGKLLILGKNYSDVYEIQVNDSGMDLPDDFNSKGAHGVGFKIIHALAAKLDAAFSIGSNQGTCATLRIPLN